MFQNSSTKPKRGQLGVLENQLIFLFLENQILFMHL